MVAGAKVCSRFIDRREANHQTARGDGTNGQAATRKMTDAGRMCASVERQHGDDSIATPQLVVRPTDG